MAETIGDYLVKLGLQVDKAQEQKFNSALNNLGKTLATMAAGLAAAATAIQATVVAVSKSFDSLYFSAQRTNSTVSGIKALSYAFTQIGGTAGEAQEALEGLAKTLRTNPGKVQWLNNQGIGTAGRKNEDVLHDIFEKFGKLPYWQGYQLAQNAGISESTFQKAYANHKELMAFEQESRDTFGKFGVDPDKAKDTSHELMTAFRSLMLHVEALITKIATDLQPQLIQTLKDISAWFEQHQEQIVRILKQILDAVKGMISDFGELAKKLEPVAKRFLDIVQALTGQHGLEAALILVTGGALLNFVKGWTGLIAMLAGSPVFWGLLALLGIDALKGGARIGLEGHPVGPGETAATPGAGDPLNQYFDRGGGIKDLWDHYGPGGTYWSGQPRGQKGASGSYGNGASGSWSGEGLNPELQRRYDKMLADAPEQVRNAIKMNSGYRSETEQKVLYEKYLRGEGPRAAPPGRSNHNSGEAIDFGFSTPEARAWVHAHAKEYGITFPLADEDWHGERAEKRGLNPNWQDDATRLKDKQSELFNSTPLGGSTTRSASLSNRTSITIYGSTDPAGTAANLGGAQSRIASDLIRNAQSAFV